MKKIFLSLLASSGLFLLSACETSEPSTSGAETEDSITFGYIGALTGDIASLGIDDRRGTEMYFEEHPEINDKTVKIVYEDAACNGQQASSAAEKLVTSDKVKLIFGATCSGETLAAASITEKNKVLLFSSVSTSPEVTDAGDFVFRNAPSDEKSTDVMADAIAENYTKVAIISQNNDFAQGYRTALLSKLEARNIEVVVDETFNTGTTDFKTVLQKVKDSDAEVLINDAGESGPAGFINKQAAELGLNLPIYGNDVMLGSEFFDIAQNSAEGTYAVATAADTSRADVQEMIGMYVERYGEPPAADVYFLLSYDRATILAKAVAEVGYDSEKIKEYLYNMEPYEGLGGRTEFDENGDSSILPSLLMARDGQFEVVK